MLKLHHDMITYNTLGVGKRIVSIFDGDAQSAVAKHIFKINTTIINNTGTMCFH